MATSSANRGKSAESQVRAVLEGFNTRVAGFTFNRVPDAHMAGGRFPAQAGDYQAFRKLANVTQMGAGTPPQMFSATEVPQSRNFIIEVKEVAHAYRLPQKNYSADKVARVQKRVWAGTEAVVAVLHTTTGLWRLVPFAVFTVRPPSWDLSSYAPVDIETALAEFMGVK